MKTDKASFKEFIEFLKPLKGYYINEAECKWLPEQFEQLEQKVKEVEAEYEVASRFGEWLKVDMSGCYDAADMVNLWKVKVNQLNEKLTASEARVKELQTELLASKEALMVSNKAIEKLESEIESLFAGEDL